MIVTFTIIKYVKKALHTVSVEINQMPKNEYANKQLKRSEKYEKHAVVSFKAITALKQLQHSVYLKLTTQSTFQQQKPHNH